MVTVGKFGEVRPTETQKYEWEHETLQQGKRTLCLGLPHCSEQISATELQSTSVFIVVEKRNIKWGNGICFSAIGHFDKAQPSREKQLMKSHVQGQTFQTKPRNINPSKSTLFSCENKHGMVQQPTDAIP